MEKIYNSLLIFFLLGLSGSALRAQTSYLAKGNGNPIIPGYFADPTVKKFGDTYYIYATTDGNGGGFGPSQVWTSKDFVNWTLQDMNWPTTHHYWAPDATLGPDGKYYLYYCQPVEIFGASSKTPVGPWTPLLAPGKPIVPNFLVPNVITLDGQTFKDDDGKYYMYWGTWGIYPNHGCGVGLLNNDMKSFSKLAQIPNTDAKDFFEAPFVFKRKGIYYLTYSSGYCEDSTYRVQYATATNSMGPFKYALDNPILATNSDGTVHGPGHQSVLQQGDDFYLIYHRHNNPHNDGGYHRQVAADKIIFDEKGNILRLIPTHAGIGYLAKNENPHPNLALGKKASASSFYDKDFKVDFAFDNNNGTLWKAKNNVGSAWIQVDLGKTQQVKSVHTQFEYATWYYQYKIEYSLGGKIWKLYADKSKNTQHGSPMIDFGNVKARYLRTTILHTEYPGLNKGIWNIQVFDNPAYKPMMNTKIKPWKSLKGFDSKGLLIDLTLSQLRVGTTASTVLNKGKLAGKFSAEGVNKPIAAMIAGKKALVFSGRERMTSSVTAPLSLLGNSSYSVSMWVLNPDIEKEETIVTWTPKGGDNLTNVAIGYGNGKNTGAAIHSGWADLGYKQLPKSKQWHLVTMVFDGTMEHIYVDGKLDRAERRMLFINKLTRFLIGGNADGTAGFSGALASLKIYDRPLTEEEISASFTKGLSNNTTVYATAKNLDYGKADTWENDGAALGKLEIKGKAEVADVAGKIALVLENNSKLILGKEIGRALNFSKPFTAIFSILASKGTINNFYFGDGNKAVQIAGDGKWQQVICSYVSGKLNVYVNGKLSGNPFVVNRQKNPSVLLESFGGNPVHLTAISSIVIYNDAFNQDACLKEFDFWKKTLNTTDLNAVFALKPSAVTPNMVYMEAQKSLLPGAVLEYLFNDEKDKKQKQWQQSATYIDFTALPQQTYSYTVKARDNFGNVTKSSLPYTVTTDSSRFLVKKQFGTAQSIPAANDVLKGTSWDGFMGNADTLTQQNGILKMISKNTFWDGSARLGPFVYHNVKGDFVAEVTLADMLGWTQKKAYGANEAGIMVKATGSNTQLLQNGIMPGWGVGNIVTDLNSSGRKQTNNLSGWTFFKKLQIQKIGNTFYLRGSNDGKDWKNLPGSPVRRDDLTNIDLQVGVYHATYGENFGYGAFSNFQIIQQK
ncbi:family 43 glycosylhydrolase [Pedobacter sp. Leaf170]|uniref:family 43 glycosylhydrolase n=1 Tax=Pedobacter sp. Leaf170 TaxID=2876558 RepID=UPI001E3360D9|nr:family 43 glycosylhydrolase [Pedobacter sp. Leaf170]